MPCTIDMCVKPFGKSGDSSRDAGIQRLHGCSHWHIPTEQVMGIRLNSNGKFDNCSVDICAKTLAARRTYLSLATGRVWAPMESASSRLAAVNGCWTGMAMAGWIAAVLTFASRSSAHLAISRGRGLERHGHR